MKQHVESEVLLELHPQQFFGDLQVPAARDGQEFGDPLDDAQEDGVKGFHVRVGRRGQKRLRMAKISKAKPPITRIGASVMRRQENMA